MKTKFVLFIIILPFLLSNAFIMLELDNSNVTSFPANNSITLSAYEYHIVSVNATQGQALSGDWRVSPADLISPPFLVFIVDTENLEIWLASDNLTQAVGRFPTRELLYLYDPLFRIDDIPGDGYRSHVFQVKVPFSGVWHLVMYAGPTFFSLTFNWNIDVFEGYLLDAVLYSLFGVCFIAAVTIFTIKAVKDRKRSYEEELDMIIQEQTLDDNKEQKKSSLEEIDEEYYDGELNFK
jgi:hypothetical protein